MALKPKEIDWCEVIDNLATQQEVEQIRKEMDQMTGRGLYTMPSYSNMASYLIDTPSINAMHGTKTNYPVDPLSSITNLLIDGAIYYKMEDFNHIRWEEYVILAEWDYFDDRLDRVVVGYLAEDEDWYYERYTRNEDGTCTKEEFLPTRKQVLDPTDLSDLELKREIEYPFFLFVGARWKEGTSFLEKPRASLIRLETAYRVIGQECVERRGLALYFTNMRKGDKIEKAPKRLGRNTHFLPKEAGIEQGPVDVPGMDLMKWEIGRLEEGIEKSTRVVSTEKLATLSGISRTIAEKPLIFLCEHLQMLYTGLLDAIYEELVLFNPPKPEVFYRSLVSIGFDKAETQIEALDKAKADGVISEEEYTKEIRSILNLYN